MSHLLHRRRGHDSEDDDDDASIVSGMATTTDYDQDEDDGTSDEEDSQEEETETETDSEYDSSEQETGQESEQEDLEDEVEQPTVQPKTKEIQATPTITTTTTTTTTNNQTTPVNEQPTMQPATAQTTEIEYQDLQQQKTVQELREYRRKLAEDPSFVPYVGLFWGHDDRYREDAFAGSSEATREPMPHFSQHHTAHNSSIKKPSYDRNLDPLMHKKWDHSGYEELLRLDEQDERRRRELIESGQSPSQVNHRPPQRLPRHHHHNARGGVGSGRGRGYRSGYQQHRFGNAHKRPFTRQQEEWPQLSTNTASTNASGNMADQSLSDNKAQEPKVDNWGSVDRVKQVKPAVKIDLTADGWGSSTNVKATDGWGSPTNAKATDGWGSAPMEAPKAEAGRDKETQKKDIPAATTAVQTESGWGTLPDTSKNDAWKAPAITETKKQPEFSTNTHSQDNWDTQPDAAAAAAAALAEPSTGWGEPTVTTYHVAGWDTVTENKDRPTGNNSTESMHPVETTTVQKTANTKEASFTTTTDGWGKPEEIAVQDSWSNNTSKDWSTPQWDTTVNSSNNSSNHSRGWSKPTSSAPLQREHTEIPSEEKASSSWASVKPDVEVHTTPSDFSKIDYNKRYDRRNTSSNYRQHQQQEEDGKAKATLNISSTQQQQDWDQKASHSSDHWADTTTTISAGWNATENVSDAQSGWTTEASTLSKSEETTKVDSSWGSKPEKTTFSWDASEASAKSRTKPAHSNDPATTTFDQSNSSSSSSVRGSGWSNSRSSNSANWNADRERNNKVRLEQQQQQQQQQSKKSRGYYAAKTTTTEVPEVMPSTTEGFNTPETSAWGNFQSTGDDDSDVEIILEAEEEPEWSKEDEQVLGMTAPDDAPQYSPPSNRMTRSYLPQQHDHSGQSSPRPEYNRSNGRHGNSKSPHRSHFDDNWRQPREDMDSYRPMYYPTPAHPPSQMNGNITYVPMIPNGNGNPMYTMPFPMGTSASSSNTARDGGRSASPSHEPPSSSAATASPHKFYTPSSPNVQPLPPGYEANGMVYYGMDPTAMYPPSQPFYYYAPQHMMANNNNDTYGPMRSSLQHPREDEDGWGPTPETVETEEQWASATNKSLQPVNNYYYPQQSHHY